MLIPSRIIFCATVSLFSRPGKTSVSLAPRARSAIGVPLPSLGMATTRCANDQQSERNPYPPDHAGQSALIDFSRFENMDRRAVALRALSNRREPLPHSPNQEE